MSWVDTLVADMHTCHRAWACAFKAAYLPVLTLWSLAEEVHESSEDEASAQDLAQERWARARCDSMPPIALTDALHHVVCYCIMQLLVVHAK